MFILPRGALCNIQFACSCKTRNVKHGPDRAKLAHVGGATSCSREVPLFRPSLFPENMWVLLIFLLHSSFFRVVLLSALVLLGGVAVRCLPLWVVVPSSPCLIHLHFFFEISWEKGSTTARRQRKHHPTRRRRRKQHYPQGRKRKQHHPEEEESFSTKRRKPTAQPSPKHHCTLLQQVQNAPDCFTFVAS